MVRRWNVVPAVQLSLTIPSFAPNVEPDKNSPEQGASPQWDRKA